MSGWEPKSDTFDGLMRSWVREQATLLVALRGEIVAGWAGFEMAIREAGPSGEPQFHDPGIPFLQIVSLYLAFASGGTRVVRSQQNLDGHSLYIDVHYGGLPDESNEEGSIYRTRLLPELPVGKIESVNVGEDSQGNIVELSLTIGANRINLWSGEVYEKADGSLRVVRPDESVLVQVSRLES